MAGASGLARRVGRMHETRVSTIAQFATALSICGGGMCHAARSSVARNPLPFADRLRPYHGYASPKQEVSISQRLQMPQQSSLHSPYSPWCQGTRALRHLLVQQQRSFSSSTAILFRSTKSTGNQGADKEPVDTLPDSSADLSQPQVGQSLQDVSGGQLAENSVVAATLSGGEDSYPFIFKLVQAVLESIHDRTLFSSFAGSAMQQQPDAAIAAMTAAATLPWWGVIAGSAVVLRACLTLPIFVFQQRAASRAQSLGKVTATWQHSMRSSLKLELASKHLSDEEFEKILKKKLKRKHHDLMLKQGCHPIMNFLLPLSQLPIWLSMTYILRHLCGIPLPFFDQADSVVPAAPGMTTEGTLWFADLSSADPTYMLPVITGCLYMANVLLARRMAKMYPPPGVPGASGSTEQSLLSKSVGGVIISTPFLMAYIALNQPASIVFYWAVSAAFSLLQNLVFQNHWLRKTLKFPHAKKA